MWVDLQAMIALVMLPIAAVAAVVTIGYLIALQIIAFIMERIEGND